MINFFSTLTMLITTDFSCNFYYEFRFLGRSEEAISRITLTSSSFLPLASLAQSSSTFSSLASGSSESGDTSSSGSLSPKSFNGSKHLQVIDSEKYFICGESTK